MVRGFTAALFGAALCILHVQPAAAQSPDGATVVRVAAQPGGLPQRLEMGTNGVVVLEFDTDVRDVIMGSPTVADAIVRSTRRVIIVASPGPGQTNAVFLDNQGRHIATMEITVGNNPDGVNAHIDEHLPQTTAEAQGINGSIILSGEVDTLASADVANRAALQMVPDPRLVVNNVAIQERQQVLIKVRVSEVSRTIAKQFGVNMAGMTDVAGVPLVARTANEFSLLGRALNDLSYAQFGRICAAGTEACPAPNNLEGVLVALERVGLVRTLAEPNLTAVSGEAARFLSGGEFPVPVGRDRDGAITVEFKQFGVGLAFTPVVLSGGRISLQISSEVSELSNNGALVMPGARGSDENGNSIIYAGITLPALSVRRTETTVELPSGGSIAIGGLIQQQTKENIDAFPGLKELPVLGALFRSRDYQNNETELVVTVSAYLVDPVAEAQLASPADGFQTPTDIEAILLGRLNAVYGPDSSGAPATGSVAPGSIGYIVQ